MKPFKLSLQTVLNIRQRDERQALEAYARQLQARHLVAMNLENVLYLQHKGWDELRAALMRGAAAGDLAHTHRHLDQIALLKSEAEKRLADAEHAVLAAWEKLTHAKRAKEVVEKFLERKIQQLKQQQLRAEQKILDDLVQRPRTPLSNVLVAQ